MAYTVPTVQDFKDRFPEIAATDPQIQAVLNEGAGAVDTSYIEAEYAPAILYYAAHLLILGQDIGSGAGIASESFGPISMSYERGGASWLSSSSYGQQFALIRLRNRGGPRIG